MCRHILKLKKMQGPENPFVYTCGLTQKKQFNQNVCSMQLMQGWYVQGWYVLMPDPYEERKVVWRRWLFPEGFCGGLVKCGSGGGGGGGCFIEM